jgi:hypothetical protein
MSVLEIRIPITNTFRRYSAEALKGLPQDRGKADFFKNLRASLFNKYLSKNEQPDPCHWAVPLKVV